MYEFIQYTLSPEKSHFYVYDNFGKYGPILSCFHLFIYIRLQNVIFKSQPTPNLLHEWLN